MTGPPDPFIALAHIRRATTRTLADLGLRVERMVADTDTDNGPRIMQIIVTAIDDWTPASVDDGFDALIEQNLQTERKEQADQARLNLEQLQQRLQSDGGFL